MTRNYRLKYFTVQSIYYLEFYKKIPKLVETIFVHEKVDNYYF